MLRLPSSRIIRLILAPLLVFWIAGMPCLFGCGMIVQAGASDASPASSTPGVMVANESCASSKSHDCCAKQNGSGGTTSANQTANSFERILNGPQDGPAGSVGECPLAVNVTAAISKVGSDQNAPVSLIADPLPPLRVVDQPIPLFEALRLPNRGHTYLRCCVFLI